MNTSEPNLKNGDGSGVQAQQMNSYMSILQGMHVDMEEEQENLYLISNDEAERDEGSDDCPVIKFTKKEKVRLHQPWIRKLDMPIYYKG